MSSEVRIINPWPGQCRDCGRRRQDCYSIGSKGGGDYRRGNRHYPSTICAACVLRMAPYARAAHKTTLTYSRWDKLRLLEIADSIRASAPSEQPTPGSLCGTCGHFAVRHDEDGCHGVKPEIGCRYGPRGTENNPVRCKVFVWVNGQKWWRPSDPDGWVKP